MFIPYIEDITRWREDMNFIFEWQTPPREWVKYCFCHEKIKFISSSRRVMFFLLYRHADDGVFDDFSKISDHLPKISEDFPKLFRIPDEHFPNIFRKFPKMSEDFRRLPKTSEEDPKMFRWYTNEFNYNIRDKPDVIERNDTHKRWHTKNTPLGSRMKWRMESTSGLVPSKTLSSI